MTDRSIFVAPRASLVVDGAWLANDVIIETNFGQDIATESLSDSASADEESWTDRVLNALIDEVNFQEVSHKGGLVPRLMAIQGILKDGKQPLYRHPLDYDPPLQPFTPIVTAIRRALVTRLRREGFDIDEDGDFNHALLQFYRSGHDYISEHADKTIDIKQGSYIVNFSLGAMRTLVLREKDKIKGVSREAVHVPLRSCSAFILGLDANRTHVHEIKRDKRRDAEKGEDERKCGGRRLSITFRTIATFLDEKDGSLTGQGALLQDRLKLLEAYRLENQTALGWNELYNSVV